MWNHKRKRTFLEPVRQELMGPAGAPRPPPVKLQGIEKAAWLKKHPECSPQGMRKVIGDYSPDSLRPMEKPVGGNFNQAKVPVDMTSALRNFYGEAVGNLSMVSLMREPLSRQYSQYFFGHHLSGSSHGNCNAELNNMVSQSTNWHFDL